MLTAAPPTEQMQTPPRRNLLVYHLLERKYTGLANKNAGDFKGDMGFILGTFSAYVNGDPEASIQRNIFELSAVNISGWGEFEVCSPPGRTGDFTCPANSPVYCCSDEKDVPVHHTPQQFPGVTASPMSLGRQFGFPGWWFSFPLESQGVTWNETLLRRIEGRCLGNAWRSAAGGCPRCGPELDECVAQCINTTLALDGSTERLQMIWDAAFEETDRSCPDVSLPSGAEVATTALSREIPVSRDDLCPAAFSARCYDEMPFQACCGDCTNGQYAVQCAYSFHDINVNFNGSFAFQLGSDSECRDACDAVSADNNQLWDYCPNGRVHKILEGCSSAKDNLASIMSPAWCPTADGKVVCQWEHTQTPFLGNHTMGDEEIISASFSFQLDDGRCSGACVLLGDAQLAPYRFCDDELKQELSVCPAALQSLMNVSIPSSWCGHDRRHNASRRLQAPQSKGEVVHMPLGLSSVTTRLMPNMSKRDLCRQAYGAQCWTSDDWSGCCSACQFGNGGHVDCQWHVQIPGEGTVLEKTFEILPDAKGQFDQNCWHACSLLTASDGVLPDDYCRGGSLYDEVEKCPQAWHGMVDVVTWCDDSTQLLASENVGVTRTIAAAALVGLFALVGFRFGMCKHILSGNRSDSDCGEPYNSF